MLRVKICGCRSPADIALAARLGADAVGIICGVRYRSEDALEPNRAAALLRSVPVLVSSVLVTHLITAEEVLNLHRLVPASTIQLHDAIAIREIEAIRRAIPHVPLIKGVGVSDESAINVALALDPYVDALLLDTHKGDRIGGTGATHDWLISRRIASTVSKPVILAGGLRPENLIQAIEAVRPFGVDVNSGVEYSSGEKDPKRVGEFISLAKGWKLTSAGADQ